MSRGRGIGVIYALEAKGMVTADRNRRVGDYLRSLKTSALGGNQLEGWTCDFHQIATA